MPLPPEANRLRPDHLPTPFSAAQIRDGSAVGRTIHVREETGDDPATYRRIRVVEAERDGVVHELESTDADGIPVGEPVRRRSAWLALQGHASVPAASSVVRETTLTLPFGTFACWLYTVREDDVERRFWFAQSLPGMPVQVEEWVGGSRRSRTRMIDNRVQA